MELPSCRQYDRLLDDMLAAIGVDSIDDLFDEIPRDLIISELEDIPPALSEMEIIRLIHKELGLSIFLIEHRMKTES